MISPAKRGRPKKAAENPDCEVATKGYVKCVARKLGQHTHDNFTVVISSGLFAAISIFALVVFGSDHMTINEISIPTILMAFTLLGLYNCLVGLFNFMSTGCSRDLNEIDNIQPHTEPPCERKKECDE